MGLLSKVHIIAAEIQLIITYTYLLTYLLIKRTVGLHVHKLTIDHLYKIS